jgi:hypothetical protein
LCAEYRRTLVGSPGSDRFVRVAAAPCGASLDGDQPVERVVEVEALAAARLAGAPVDRQLAVRGDEPAGVAARQPRSGLDLGAPTGRRSVPRSSTL